MDNTKQLTRLVNGLCVSHVVGAEHGAVAIHFTNGAVLLVRRNDDGVRATFQEPDRRVPRSQSGNQPTRRQREYLDFIQKYMARFGVAPAESAIEQHFLVSAPSVHQMIRTLERRGFITRRYDFTGQASPRSIRIVDAG